MEKVLTNNLILCAGKHCVNTGIKLLKIKHLHKEGWFCENCSKELLAENLVEEINQTSESKGIS